MGAHFSGGFTDPPVESSRVFRVVIKAMSRPGQRVPIGLKLFEAMRTNSNWANVCYMVLLILIVVYIFDGISTSLRRRLVSGVSG